MATASRSQAQWSPRSSMGAAPPGAEGQKHAAFLKHFPGRRRDDAAGLGLGAAHEAGPLLRRGPGPGHGAFHISGVHAAAGEHHSVRREGHGGGAAQHEDVHRGRVHGLLDGRSPRQRALETAVVRLALAHQHDRGGAARGHGLARRPGEIRPSPLHHAGLVVHGVLHIGAGGKSGSRMLWTRRLSVAPATFAATSAARLVLPALSLIFPLLPTARRCPSRAHRNLPIPYHQRAWSGRTGTKSPKDRDRCQAPGRSAPR